MSDHTKECIEQNAYILGVTGDSNLPYECCCPKQRACSICHNVVCECLGTSASTYLGDGVYASWDGHHIWLDLRGQDNTTRIALEENVFNNLVAFKESL